MSSYESGDAHDEKEQELSEYSGTSSNASSDEGALEGVDDQGCWTQLVTDTVPPGPRAAHSFDLIGGNKIYVFGGWNGKKAMNDMYILDIETLRWRQLRVGGSPPERNNHTTAVIGNRLYVHGGHDGTKWLEDMYVFDSENAYWTELTDLHGSRPRARACHTLSAVNQKLYMFGGYDGADFFNDIVILNLDTEMWSRPRVSGTPPNARNAHTMTVIYNKLFLFGGHCGNEYLADLHIFDTIGLKWIKANIHGTPPPGLRGHTANLIGDQIFVFGGYNGKERCNDLHTLDCLKMTWAHPQEMERVPSGRQRHSATLVARKQLFIFGGFDGTQWLNDLHVLDLSRLAQRNLVEETVRNLTENMKTLVGNPEFSDVKLIVGDIEIPAHKNILAVQCPYFQLMFSNKMKESTESKVLIQHWTSQTITAVLEFLYTGRMCETTPSIVREALGVSDSWGLDSLKSICQNILKHSVDDKNVCQLLEYANRFRALELQSYCEDYILHHAADIIKEPSFKELSKTPELVWNLLRLFLSRHTKAHHTSETGEGPISSNPAQD